MVARTDLARRVRQPPCFIGMVLHPERDATHVVRAVLRWARANGARVLLAPDDALRLAAPGIVTVPTNQIALGSDLLLAAGGDGTVLRAMRLAARRGIPVLAVNMGRLGYLTELELGQVESGLAAIARGDFTVEPQTALRVQARRAGPLLAFNDVVVSRRRGQSQAVIDLRIDGDLFVRHAGDGLIVSSPAGSTGYGFSAGGPIMSPRLTALVVTPLAPHAAFNRSIVLSPTEAVSLEVLADSSSLALEIDGRENVDVPPGSHLTVEAVPHAGSAIRLGRSKFADNARRRLGIEEAGELRAGDSDGRLSDALPLTRS